jgi:hypothetical protein
MNSVGEIQFAFDFSSNGYISKDYGKTWTLVVERLGGEFGTGINCVAMSSTGEFQTAVGGILGSKNSGIYISSDYGNTWNQTSNPKVDNIYWNAISLSSSGKYQSAVGNNGLFTSNNFGKTWKKNSSSNIENVEFNFIALNSSGEIQIANDFNTIWKSSDYGKTWVKIFDLPLTTQFSLLVSVAISSTGDVEIGARQYPNIPGTNKFRANGNALVNNVLRFGLTYNGSLANFPCNKLNFYPLVDNGYGIGMSGSSVDYFTGNISNGGSHIFYTGATDTLFGTERMRIASDGNVGV